MRLGSSGQCQVMLGLSRCVESGFGRIGKVRFCGARRGGVSYVGVGCVLAGKVWLVAFC